jgi:2-iminobutanoate/2-iminopropanoate deaminase
MPSHDPMTQRAVVATPSAPRAIGPYSQAISAGGLVFLSGQIAIDPATGDMIGASDVKAQTHRVLQNLKAVLEAAGTSFDRVVKTTIFLADLQDFSTVNEIYATYFTGEPPARATVQVSGLPRGALVEIDAIALAT